MQESAGGLKGQIDCDLQSGLRRWTAFTASATGGAVDERRQTGDELETAIVWKRRLLSDGAWVVCGDGHGSRYDPRPRR